VVLSPLRLKKLTKKASNDGCSKTETNENFRTKRKESGVREKKTATNNNKQWQIFGKLASKTLQNIISLQ